MQPDRPPPEQIRALVSLVDGAKIAMGGNKQYRVDCRRGREYEWVYVNGHRMRDWQRALVKLLKKF